MALLFEDGDEREVRVIDGLDPGVLGLPQLVVRSHAHRLTIALPRHVVPVAHRFFSNLVDSAIDGVDLFVNRFKQIIARLLYELVVEKPGSSCRA